MQHRPADEAGSESHASSTQEGQAADGQSGLQASSSDLSSSEAAQEDFMHLLSTALSAASQIGTDGLKPLLDFPGVLYEHLQSENVTCEVILLRCLQCSIFSSCFCCSTILSKV